MLHHIDERCRIAKSADKDKNHLYFGGMNVILFTDFAQLSPEYDSPVWLQPQSEAKDPLGLTESGYLVYRSFKTVIFLEKVMNCQDLRYIEILENIRNGIALKEDFDYIIENSLQEKMPQYPQLYATLKEVIRCNNSSLVALGAKILRIKAEHSSPSVEKVDASLLKGILPTQYFSKGAPVRLTTNMMPDIGLIEGTMGYIRDIIFQEYRIDAIPDAIIVEFPSMVELPKETRLIPDQPKMVPIMAVTAKCKLGTRKGFALQLSYASTIQETHFYKTKITNVNLGKQEYPGLTYYALSRVPDISKVFLKENFNFERYQKFLHVRRLVPRLKEELRLKLLMWQSVSNVGGPKDLTEDEINEKQKVEDDAMLIDLYMKEFIIEHIEDRQFLLDVLDCQNRQDMIDEMFDRAEIDPAWNRIYSEFVAEDLKAQDKKEDVDRKMQKIGEYMTNLAKQKVI